MQQQDNRESNHHNGVHHSPTNRDNRNNRSTNYRPTLNSHGCSDDSEDMSQTQSPQVVRSTHTSGTKYIQVRRSSSEDESRKDDQYGYPLLNGHAPNAQIQHKKTTPSKSTG